MPAITESAIDQEIAEKGLTAARVTPAQIDELMLRVMFIFGGVPGTTSTFCHAFLDGRFYLASGHSACVSIENFDAELGMKLARSNAEGKARDRLWELEGWSLYKTRCIGQSTGGAMPGARWVPCQGALAIGGEVGLLPGVHAFTFELGQPVAIECSGEQGEVIGRCEHSKGEDQYMVRYAGADGRAVEAWWGVSALAAVAGEIRPA